MKLRTLSCILIVSCVPGTLLTGQNSYRFWGASMDRLVLPFELSQNLVIISTRINKSPELQLVLDSGINNTIITSLTGVDSITVKEARKIKVGGLGGGTPIDAFYSRGNQIEIENPGQDSGGISGDSMDIFVLSGDQFELSRQLGIQVNGLLGSDLFGSFIIGIDAVSRQITFHNPETFNYKKRTRGYSRIPLDIRNGKAYIDVVMVQENDSELTVKLLIDTGASLAFWIATEADSTIIIPQKTVRSLLGQGLNGLISGVNGRVKRAEIGPFAFRKPLVSYPDSASIAGLTLNERRHGSIGNDILRRFDVLFDFRNSSIYLKPNKFNKSPFSYNRSGMDVEKADPRIPVYSIFSIIPDSPADRAGLKAGDVIEFINYLPAFSLNLDDINNILYGENGRIILLRIDRNGEKIKVHFYLDEKI